MRNAKLALGALTAAIVLGCSPVARLRVSFALPKSAGGIDFAKLHVRARVACESFNLADPKPKDPEPPLPGAEDKDDELQREGEHFQTSQRASSCKAAATAWYDTNANGVPDRGDFVATMPSTEFHDRGLCAGNLTTVGPLQLEPWTP